MVGYGSGFGISMQIKQYMLLSSMQLTSIVCTAFHRFPSIIQSLLPANIPQLFWFLLQGLITWS